MIALPSISQVNYIINSDSLVCYTHIENRNIAIIFLDGDKNKELLTTCNDYNTQLENTFNNLNTELSKCETLSNDCIKDNRQLSNIVTKQSNTIKTYKYISYGSLGLNVLLIIILL